MYFKEAIINKCLQFEQNWIIQVNMYAILQHTHVPYQELCLFCSDNVDANSKFWLRIMLDIEGWFLLVDVHKFFTL